MARDWVVRTDWHNLHEVILPSLDEGMVRQGWGYQDDQNLDVIGPVVYEQGRGALSDDQKATWRRVQRFLARALGPGAAGRSDPSSEGPWVGSLAARRGRGQLPLRAPPVNRDHGHILPVRTIVPDIASSNSAVSARLQRTMRNQGPMWNVDALSKDIDRLLAAGDTVARGDAPTDRLNNVLNDTLERLLPRLRDDFRSNQLEEPVFRLLTHLFPTAVVEKRAGPHEQGADFLIVETDAFGHEHRTVVQLKDYAEQLSGMTALNQIREASAAYAPVSAAVILTTAQDESRDFARARDDLGEELAIPVTTVLGLQLARWFLAHLEAIAAD